MPRTQKYTRHFCVIKIGLFFDLKVGFGTRDISRNSTVPSSIGQSLFKLNLLSLRSRLYTYQIALLLLIIAFVAQFLKLIKVYLHDNL